MIGNIASPSIKKAGRKFYRKESKVRNFDLKSKTDDLHEKVEKGITANSKPLVNLGLLDIDEEKY